MVGRGSRSLPTSVRVGRVVAAGAILITVGCSTATPSPTSSIPHGGTLHVAVPAEGFYPEGYAPPDKTTLDLNSQNSATDAFELWRCCLGRTLLGYNGQPTERGGADLHPDLTTGTPEVSRDGLTWTFHIRPNLHYAPPLQHVEITAADFIRALQRVARVGSTPPYYDAIEGFRAYAKGGTESIAGLQTPDSHTLVVRLTAPTGDLVYRMSLPYLSPLPPAPNQPNAVYGVATGHDDGETSFIVSSGPYMLEGSDKVNLSLPVAEQMGASGVRSGRSITLVRNPSWSAASDSLRAAYADRIVVDYIGTIDDAVAAVGAGREDIIVRSAPPPQIPIATLRAYESDHSKGVVDIRPRDGVRYMSMNLATPPFDDIHVRRAVAYVLDRRAIETAFGGEFSGSVTGHLALDSMEDNALINYDPYRSKDAATRLRSAQQEMAESRYDSKHVGTCDATVCQHVVTLAFSNPQTPAAMAETFKSNLEEIGVHPDITALGGRSFFAQVTDPTKDPAMALFWGYGKDYPNGADFFVQQFSRDALESGGDFTLIGATAAELQGWGYSVHSVPNVQDRIDACLPLVGDPQRSCWTSLDQYMMEKVVAVLPFVSETYDEIVPARIASYSFDQSLCAPALDRIAIAK